ncbi:MULTISPECIES: paraquat-inducible protein A [Halocynthiibacter]|uniref:Paraquat-inducible protein A n=1 Tax=Halocynthiibacter halioticoli TaxID=2986804 RepID=A0AAE3LRP4_9RHOB|nr:MULTISPECIES: paraquat-inducible protein A [Halocynthiibacter]MCV6824669.1 paraquat-inducible protein A [Halocynthiibacter halioticoli]MCW4057670.1 paraquat-inducible protein A [Halocynthiibacter sp. SDUM655004]MDE0589292.1 paraquat-inducible protein A [Halocynthiibacter sp. C4]
MKTLRILNLALLVAFPVAWFAPLLRAGILPLFSLNEISVMSGVIDLWQIDIFLAVLVTFFALVAPICKTLGLAMIHAGRMDARALPVLHLFGRLAMADIFLISLYIVVIKGIGVGRVETGWGLYLFTACVLLSLWVSFTTERLEKAAKKDINAHG